MVQHEADHSSPSAAEVKNAWSYTSTLPYVLMAWYSVKHGHIFVFCPAFSNPPASRSFSEIYSGEPPLLLLIPLHKRYEPGQLSQCSD
jgi:hypothetical protein